MENESIKFLISLLPFYKKKEKYILSKLRNLNIDNTIQSLFCKNCLHLFVPTVNCEISLNDNFIKINCMNCEFVLLETIDLEKKVNFVKEKEESFSFEDFFK
ncbi:hypothetical protein TUBRATIS_17330 [Tubulinosema ratisbonensis]|uniref:Uncharacterized protein n=1 Tax=Tubulinosema ratisbonensis TaxID=291195 RepID=A0A437AL34_9MICR|nr:hypothetical protein TUBRATIS_17330 [Tubulinosema ratisbonensis]